MQLTKDSINDSAVPLREESVVADSGLDAPKETPVTADGLSMTGRSLHVALLTGGGDKPYTLCLASSLISHGVALDVIGSDEIDVPELQQSPLIRFLNLRGDVRPDVAISRKVLRVLIFYGRLLRYAATSKAKVFHIFWNNRLELLDRTLLMLYYQALGKRIAFTAHNVNKGRRDGNDSLLNRLSLKIQYRLVDHIFVHTEKMKQELRTDFGVPDHKISVIRYGVCDSAPDTALTPVQAKQRLALTPSNKVVLFFGRILPYKGLEYLVRAMATLAETDPECRLVIAGSAENCAPYWEEIQQRISRLGLQGNVIERIEFVPDVETEIYFKAADVLVLPYTEIFQSGVLFLAYAFGLPVIASDVGSFREDVIEGKTGHICQPRDSEDLSAVIRSYFDGDLYAHLEQRRPQIVDYARQHHSWATVAEITCKVYAGLVADKAHVPYADQVA